MGNRSSLSTQLSPHADVSMPQHAAPGAGPIDTASPAATGTSAHTNSLPVATEGLLHSVFSAMREGLVVQERGGAIIHANPAAQRILGLSADEMAGRTSVDPRWRAEREDGSPFPGETHPAMVALATGRPVHGVVMVVHKPDGTRRLIEINAEPIPHPGRSLPQHVIATFLDITERRAADDALHSLADRLSDLYNHAPCGYHSLGPDGVYLEVNDTELDWLGVTREEVVGRKRPVDFMTTQSQATFARTFPLVRDGHHPHDIEVDFVGANGRVRHASVSATRVLDGNGHFVMTRSVVYDITDLVKMRRELEQRAGDQAAMLDNDVIAVARLRERRVVWANTAAARLFGYDAADMVGMPTRDVYPSEEAHQKVGAAFYDEVRARGSFRTQTELVRKDGGRVFVEVYGSPLADSGDHLAFFSDLTSIRTAQARLLESHKMESVGRLAGGIAHEFNNKLQTILGVTELAMFDAAPEGGLRRDLTSIQSAARHAATITKQLMAYAGRQPAWPRRLDLTESVAGTLALLTPSLPSAVQVTRRFDDDLWPVAMDPAQFAEILTNLALNAGEALGQRAGCIAVDLRNVVIDVAQAAENPDARPGNYVALVVRDDGPGMPPEVAQRAFEPFFTTKPFGSNSGLGLSTVYGVATQNGGWVRLVSEQSRGTAVTVYLPHAGGSAATGANEHTRPSPPTVLVVEDDLAVAGTTEAMLRRRGYTVVTTTNADEALALARARTSPIHLLLADVVLPGTNGRDLAEILKQDRPGLRVVLMSVYAGEVLPEHCPSVTHTEVLAKPFTFEELARRLAAELRSA